MKLSDQFVHSNLIGKKLKSQAAIEKTFKQIKIQKQSDSL